MSVETYNIASVFLLYCVHIISVFLRCFGVGAYNKR